MTNLILRLALVFDGIVLWAAIYQLRGSRNPTPPKLHTVAPTNPPVVRGPRRCGITVAGSATIKNTPPQQLTLSRVKHISIGNESGPPTRRRAKYDG